MQLGDGDLADYFTKVAHDVTSSHRKEGKRQGGRTPMQLLADAVDTYRVEDVDRWWAWEHASEGRRQLTWSTGARDLRKLAGLGREATDDEIADEDLAGEDHVVVAPDLWRRIVSVGQEATLLDVAERDSPGGAHFWLARAVAALPLM